nr:MAG TPA: hypothetical protein [Caudoviricetes sp.]
MESGDFVCVFDFNLFHIVIIWYICIGIDTI